MRWKLSRLEEIVDANIVCVVRLEGSVHADRLRSALSRVQRRHPALRALIHREADGLYCEADSAPDVPLRIVSRATEADYRRECEIELTTRFADDRPQLRAVWLPSELESDLLLTATHRMCDGMSVFIIAREVLRALHTDEELIPYEPVTVRDIIGDYQPPQPWKRRLAVKLINGLLTLIPASRRAPDIHEHCVEWRADAALSHAVQQRCRAEGVSVHAALVVALERALFAVFGKNLPKSIVNPIDLRRGRVAALKGDMMFSGGGSFPIRTESVPEVDFWARARSINEQIPKAVEQELRDIPGRFQFFEMLRPLSNGQIQWIVRVSDALKMNGGWNRFGLSNLGNVVLSGGDAPFRLKDVHLYVHSFNIRMLGLIPYTVNGEMSFCWVSDDTFMSRAQVDTLKRSFIAILQDEVPRQEDGRETTAKTVYHRTHSRRKYRVLRQARG